MLKNERHTNQSDVKLLGSSLGEITALVCGGLITFEQGLRLIKTRAAMMTDVFSRHEPTGMIFISVGSLEILARLEEFFGSEAYLDFYEKKMGEAEGRYGYELRLAPAIFLGAEKTILSGFVAEINLFKKWLKKNYRKGAVTLGVGGAFHHRILSEMRGPYQEFLSRELWLGFDAGGKQKFDVRICNGDWAGSDFLDGKNWYKRENLVSGLVDQLDVPRSFGGVIRQACHNLRGKQDPGWIVDHNSDMMDTVEGYAADDDSGN
jgi:hypothetical protein